MNGAQLHLLLNHLPVIVPIVALPIFIGGWIFQSVEIQRVGLLCLLIGALTAIPTYLSGDGAETLIKNYPDVDRTMIAAHRAAALRSLIVLEVAGSLSLLLLCFAKRRSAFWSGMWFLLVLLTVGSIGLVGWTAHLGGFIRHEEIRPLELLQPPPGAIDPD